MARHRIHRTRSIAFKRRFVLEYLAGKTLHGPAGRHDLSRTPIRIRVDKYETGAFDEDAGRPGVLAATVVDGLERGEEEIFVGPDALDVAARLATDAKGVERDHAQAFTRRRANRS